MFPKKDIKVNVHNNQPHYFSPLNRLRADDAFEESRSRTPDYSSESRKYRNMHAASSSIPSRKPRQFLNQPNRNQYHLNKIQNY